MAAAAEILTIDPATYVSHSLHHADRAWPETNCYVDLWVELLHALQLNPVASFAFTLAMDFEGDQWTFFKPSLADLYTLYGIDVQELTIWRPVATHVLEQITLGRPVLVEVDSFFLPDTQGVAYRQEHTKTTIAAQAIDPETRTLGYFHNAGYFRLGGDDFDGIFCRSSYAGKEHGTDTVRLAPYTEIAKLDHIVRRTPSELRTLARTLAHIHAARRPHVNPVSRYKRRFPDDIVWLSGEDIATFHQYAFATLRQCGACAELAGSFLRWLEPDDAPELQLALAAFETIATNAKALQFKVARAVNTHKPIDCNPLFDAMEAAWETAMHYVARRYGG